VKNARSGILSGDFRGTRVTRFVEGRDRAQLKLLPSNGFDHRDTNRTSSAKAICF
jgi:hypothetical protein